MNKEKIPNPQEIQQDLKKFIEDKYGAKVVFPEQDFVGQKPGVDGIETGEIDLIKFDLKPQELESYLKQYIVEQSEAIETLATKICTHFHRMRFERENPQSESIVGRVKSNIMLIGPTGVGKTYLVKLIAHKIGVPFVKGDATKFSETGYVGGDVEDLVRDLVQEARGNIKLAEYGIIYIDEIDKIASSQGHFGPDVSRTGVQRNLLKLMEETDVDLKVPHDLASQMEAVLETQKTGKAPRKKINTGNILFVVSGAFDKLDEIVRKRIKTNKIGFTEEPKRILAGDEYLDFVRTEDLIQYGFESEFIGRLPVIARLKNLGVEGLYKILKNPKSAVISGKKRDFLAYGIDLNFDDEALRIIAERADLEKTGARGLISVMEKILLPFEKRLPSTDIKRLNVSVELINNPQDILRKILFDDALSYFQRKFLIDTGIVLEFTHDAIETLHEKMSSGEDIREFLDNNFKDYGYGLKLIGVEDYKITAEVVKNPGDHLNTLIKKSYRRKKSD